MARPKKTAKTSVPDAPDLPKAPTGIQGLDEITGGVGRSVPAAFGGAASFFGFFSFLLARCSLPMAVTPVGG